MCGIAGIVGAGDDRHSNVAALQAMAQSMSHRGPDDRGFFWAREAALASTRLSIVDLENGHQPVFNEDASVVVVYNGELFDHRPIRDALQARGHTFGTACDTEIIVHLWEEYGEELFEHLRGQFAFALYDLRQRLVVLARDRVGICPLHWARRGNQLFFASEVKALLASGRIAAEPDIRGVDHIFSMFAMPTRRTPFREVFSLAPGSFMKIQLRGAHEPPRASESIYWDLDFPDHGDESPGTDDRELVEGFGDVFRNAVRRRLQADVPVVGYLSGGIDSAAVCAVASQLRDEPLHAFSIKIDAPFFNEEAAARANAEAIGCRQTLGTCDPAELLDTYPQLVLAAENPVVDTSCCALYRLAAEVREQGYKVTLSGEGADEALGGYPWFKVNRLLELLDWGSFKPSRLTRFLAARAVLPHLLERDRLRIIAALGGTVAQADFYPLFSTCRRRLYHPDIMRELDDFCAFEELALDRRRMNRWHPLNRSLYVGYKTLLAGMLLSHKSDRVAMAHSVEARYPFLDEDVIAYCAKLPPAWKLRGILHDKRVLRKMAAGLLPTSVVRRPKKMFRAPFGATILAPEEPFVTQLLSESSLRRAGYFDPRAVRNALTCSRAGYRLRLTRCFDEMALVAVFATQLWHHTFIDGNLCELPSWASTHRVSPPFHAAVRPKVAALG